MRKSICQETLLRRHVIYYSLAHGFSRYFDPIQPTLSELFNLVCRKSLGTLN